MSAEAATVAIVIVNYRTASFVMAALEALRGERQYLPAMQVVVVDGASGDDSVPTLTAGLQAPDFAGWTSLLALPINGGFGWANNQAIMRLLQSETPPDYIHLLNPDTEVEPGAVARLIDTMVKYPDCGAAGSLLVNADGSASGSAFRFHSPATEFVRGSRTGRLGRALGIKPVLIEDGAAGEAEWVTGASVVLRASALREVGLFDSGFFLYFEEVELMWRMGSAGWTLRHVPSSRVRHIGGASTGMTYDFSAIAVAPPLPGYWFQSRRRYFTLTQGRGASIVANCAWLLGHALFKLRLFLGIVGTTIPNKDEGRDMLRHGILPDAQDMRPAITHWNDPLDHAPAWMEQASV